MGELKKKKGQSIAIVCMFGLSLAFIIVSVLLIYSSTILVNDFVDMSNINSVIAWKNYDSKDDIKLKQLMANKPYIKDIEKLDAVSVNNEDMVFSNNSSVSEFTSCYIFSNNQKYNKTFSINDNRGFSLSDGEIAIPFLIANNQQLHINDKVTINVGGKPFKFVIKHIFKDALFGNKYMSTKRIIVSENDLANIIKVCSPNKHSSFIGVNLDVNTKNTIFLAALSEYNIPISFIIDHDLLLQVYGTSNGVIAMLFVTVAIFIAIILFFIQRYSIQSTIEDEYENIGLMKSTGFQNRQIITIYMSKYLFIGICGLIVSLVLGGIFFKLLLSDYFKFVVVKSWLEIWGIILSLIIISGIGFIIISYLYLRRISKLSPIEMKDNREAKNKKPFLSFKACKKERNNTMLILAINDLIQNFANYIKIIVTLLLCFTLLLTVKNFKNTIMDNEFINYFGVTVGDIYCDLNVKYDQNSGKINEVNNTVNKLNLELKKNNENVEIGVDFFVDSRIIDENGISTPITTLKSATSTVNFSSNYIKGTSPINEYEIVLSNVLAKRYNVDVGDNIMLEVEGVKNYYKITAINQVLYNMGEMILLSDNYQVKSDDASYRFIAFVNSPDKETEIVNLQNKYKYLKGQTIDEMIRSLLGNLIDQIALATNILQGFILVFTIIIVTLFVKMLCFKDSPTFLQFHNIGASDNYIANYQLLKSFMFITLSIILGILCAMSIGKISIIKLFELMTGIVKFDLIVNFVDSFLTLPLVFLIIVLFITAITQGNFIKKQSYKKEY